LIVLKGMEGIYFFLMPTIYAQATLPLCCSGLDCAERHGGYQAPGAIQCACPHIS